MITGIGIDTVDLHRIEKLVGNQKFLEKILTEQEYEYSQKLQGKRRVEYVAGRFAAKEAISKALGTGIGEHFQWQSISILTKDSGAPEVIWHSGKVPFQIHLSITHSEQLAMAYVIIEEKKIKSMSS